MVQAPGASSGQARELARVAKLLSIAYRGHQRDSHHWPDVGNTLQAPARRGVAADLGHSDSESFDSLIQVAHFLAQFVKHLVHRTTEPVVRVFKNLRQPPARIASEIPIRS